MTIRSLSFAIPVTLDHDNPSLTMTAGLPFASETLECWPEHSYPVPTTEPSPIVIPLDTTTASSSNTCGSSTTLEGALRTSSDDRSKMTLLIASTDAEIRQQRTPHHHDDSCPCPLSEIMPLQRIPIFPKQTVIVTMDRYPCREPYRVVNMYKIARSIDRDQSPWVELTS